MSIEYSKIKVLEKVKDMSKPVKDQRWVRRSSPNRGVYIKMQDEVKVIQKFQLV